LHQASPRGIPSLRYRDPAGSPNRSKLRSLALAAPRGLRFPLGRSLRLAIDLLRSLRLVGLR
jgi:hypothetical protein